MTKRVVLITGASRGLGKSLSQKFRKEEYSVISGVRNLKEAPKGTFPVLLEMTNGDSLENGVQEVIQAFGKIDVLIHNAGVAYVGPVDSFTIEEAKNLFEINFFGPLRLTQLILPYMRAQKSGKIIFISSVRAVDSGAYIGMYSASKTAFEAVAFDWAVTLARWNISVSIFQPGPIDTGIELQKGSYFREKNPYASLKNFSLDVQTTEEVSDVLMEHLMELNPPHKFQSSKDTTTIVNKHLVDSTGNEWLREQTLWASENL